MVLGGFLLARRILVRAPGSHARTASQTTASTQRRQLTTCTLPSVIPPSTRTGESSPELIGVFLGTDAATKPLAELVVDDAEMVCIDSSSYGYTTPTDDCEKDDCSVGAPALSGLNATGTISLAAQTDECNRDELPWTDVKARQRRPAQRKMTSRKMTSHRSHSGRMGTEHAPHALSYDSATSTLPGPEHGSRHSAGSPPSPSPHGTSEQQQRNDTDLRRSAALCAMLGIGKQCGEEVQPAVASQSTDCGAPMPSTKSKRLNPAALEWHPAQACQKPYSGPGMDTVTQPVQLVPQYPMAMPFVAPPNHMMMVQMPWAFPVPMPLATTGSVVMPMIRC